jgi:hypothetical protein
VESTIGGGRQTRKANSRREVVSRSSAQPLSVALTAPQRQALAREGERRGMALSTTVRTLALERLREVATEDELQRARRWQSAEARKIFDQLQAGTMGEASQGDIDALFADLDEPTPIRSKGRR